LSCGLRIGNHGNKEEARRKGHASAGGQPGAGREGFPQAEACAEAKACQGAQEDGTVRSEARLGPKVQDSAGKDHGEAGRQAARCRQA
jgi:hypothetical protein